MPEIGRLDRFIEIYEPQKTLDAAGQEQIEWVLFHDAFARPNAITGKERWMSGREINKRTVRFIIRYFDGIHEEMIVRYEGEDYDIIGVLPIGNRNRRFLEITTEYRRETGIKG